jgi:hypothetical protein
VPCKVRLACTARHTRRRPRTSRAVVSVSDASSRRDGRTYAEPNKRAQRGVDGGRALPEEGEECGEEVGALGLQPVCLVFLRALRARGACGTGRRRVLALGVHATLAGHAQEGAARREN